MAAAADDAGGQAMVSDVSVLLCDDVMHKLHCLDYEGGYCIPRDVQPFHRLYFALPPPPGTGSGVTFHSFTALCTWLLSLCKRPFPTEKMEDPSSLLARLAAELKTLGYESYTTAYDASAGGSGPLNALKLRSGQGETAVRVLAFLCDRALDARGWKWSRPRFTEGEGLGDDGAAEVEEEEVVGGDDDEEADIIGDKDAAAAAAMNAGTEDGEEEQVGGIPPASASGVTSTRPTSRAATSRGGSRNVSASAGGGGGGSAGRWRTDTKTDDVSSSAGHDVLGILESTVDATAWRNEVERVAPKLKAPGAGGIAHTGPASAGREWRSHLEQTQSAEGIITSTLPDTRANLEGLAGDLGDLLSTVAARERSINTSFKHLAVEYGTVSDRASETSAAYTAASSRVSELTAELANLHESLEETQGAMTEKGSSMTDTSPLIKIKAALSALRNEVKLMDLHVGVVGHAVMQSKISHKVNAGDATTAVKKKRGDGSASDED